jgi:hypothetical protein
LRIVALSIAILCSFFLVSSWATAASPAKSTSTAPSKNASAIDWNAWFKKNVMASDKKEYVHIFWNAQDVRKQFEGKSRVSMLAQASVELIRRQYPTKATADLVKIDIVFVKERDEYGMPKWSSMERVAHLEGSKSELLQMKPDTWKKSKDAEMKALFKDFRVY